MFFRKKSTHEPLLENRQKRLKDSPTLRSIPWKSLWGYSLFFVIIFVTAFWKQTHIGTPLILNFPAKMRVVSAIDFEYISEIKTQAAREQRKHMVSPVYKVDMTAFRNFAQKIERLKEKLAQCAELKNADKKESFITALREEFETKYNLSLEQEDLKTLLAIKTTLQRNRLLDESLFVLQEIVQKGIFDDIDFNSANDTNIYFTINKNENDYENLQSKGNALKVLRMNLFVMDIEYEVANALIHIYKYGLMPNLVYDKKKTQEKLNVFLERTPNVTVKIAKGTVLVENGQLVTPEIYECYNAYFKILENEDNYRSASNTALIKKIFLMVFLFAIVTLILQIVPSRLHTSSRLKVVVACTLFFNVLLIRLINVFCSVVMFESQCLFASFATFLVPTFLSSLIITALTDTFAGFLCTFFVVGVKSFIVYGTFDMFLLDLFVGMLMVALCRKVRFKEHIIKAGLCGYSVLMLFVFLHSFFTQHLPLNLCLQQSLAIVVGGVFTLLLCVNLIPFLEKAFRYTTDMTFLSLTDYNHPLLKKLQELAPGTYHHSLMVASLAETVAAEVGANPLLCRCCALYHDIGKLIKPEYFTENQRDGENPHVNQLPSMSAIILKSHVKEGIELAKSYKLPKAVIDVIKQHHGTSLMRYFYKKACLMKGDDEKVDEKIFHYDGPKPQFKESAIISLADAIEAASRSLEKITPQSVQELVDQIVKDRIENNQFNECNITLQDLDIIRRSLQIVLLNMSHARVRYDKIEVKTQKDVASVSP